MPTLLTTVSEIRAFTATERRAGRTVALVPTMGALHEGHLELVRQAQSHADTVVVSIFVNPLQFGAGEDLERYPRDVQADLRLLATRAAAVFAPSVDEMYPSDQGGTRVVAGEVATRFEGATRPGHFDGVLTVVAKLVGMVQPDLIIFGQKDAQQVCVVQQMVTDLNLPVRVSVCPIVRDRDGLALSSRNRYLSAVQRHAARVVPGALDAAASEAQHGSVAARDAAVQAVTGEPLAELDYIDLVDPVHFRPVPATFAGDALAIIAARIGTTRLIDNRTVTIVPPEGLPATSKLDETEENTPA